jgi:NADH-quinone oxidoreductase subunit L
MTRLYILTFEGPRAKDARIPEEQVHESGWAMTSALVILAALSVVAILYGIPLMRGPDGHLEPVMQNFLSPVFRTAERIMSTQGTVAVDHSGSLVFSWVLAWVIALAATAAAAFAYFRFFPSRAGQPVPAPARRVRTWAREKFYVDELYDTLILKPIKGGSFVLFKVVDALLIDTFAVRGTAWVTARAGSMLRYLQTGDAQSYAAVMALALLGGVAWALVKVMQ